MVPKSVFESEELTRVEDIFLLALAVTSMLLLRVAAARGTSVISDTERDGRFVDAAKSSIDLRWLSHSAARSAQDYYSRRKSDPPSLLRKSKSAHYGGLLTDVL